MEHPKPVEAKDTKPRAEGQDQGDLLSQDQGEGTCASQSPSSPVDQVHHADPTSASPSQEAEDKSKEEDDVSKFLDDKFYRHQAQLHDLYYLQVRDFCHPHSVSTYFWVSVGDVSLLFFYGGLIRLFIIF